MLERSTTEAGVCLLTSLLIAAALGRGSTGDAQAHGLLVSPSTALSLLLLTIAAIFAERHAGHRLGAMYRQRAAASTGLAVGSMALPWLLGGLATRQHAAGLSSTAAAAAVHTCLAASAVAVLLLLRGCALQQENSSKRTAAAGGRSLQQALPWWARWALAAALAAVALQATAAEAALGIPRAAALVATAAAACAFLPVLLAGLPGTFTIGEAIVAAQAAALLGSCALQQLLQTDGHGSAAAAVGAAAPCQRFVLLLMASSILGSALLFLLLLAARQHSKGMAHGPAPSQQGSNGSHRPPGLPAAALAAAVVAALAAAAAAPAALWALRFALASRRRLLLLCWWAVALAAALPAMARLNGSGRVPAILVRKGYHLLAVALFLPALLTEPQLLGVALAGAFLALLAVEAARLSGLPGIAPRIHAFMVSFTDARDSGPLLITHFTLLLGMAMPVWLSNALLPGTLGAAALEGAAEGAGGLQQQQAVWLAGHAGIIILGFGDTAASAVGSLYGRLPICHGSKKTVEGTVAAAGASLAAWWLLAAALAASGSTSSSAALGIASWPALAAATTLSCLLEAATTQLDNIFMPLHYFALLCLL